MLLLSLHATLHFSSRVGGDSDGPKGRRFKLNLKSSKLFQDLPKRLGPTEKVKGVRDYKKSTKAPARGVVIKETPEMPLSKKKQKVDGTRGKGIELLSQVALTEDDQFEEVRKKNMRDFHKTHPSRPGTVTKTTPSAAKIKPSVTRNDEDDSNNEQDSSDEDSEQENDSDDNQTQSDDEYEIDSDHETEENKSGSESDHEENEDDEEEVKDEFVKTPSNDSDDEDETKIDDKIEGDEDEEMDYTTSQLYDDIDIRQNKLVDSDKGKFVTFHDIPHTDAEVVSPMDVHVYHEVPSQPIPKLLTLPVVVIADSSPVFSTIIP
ncbi:hypothetical protein Tco_0578642 [Tanacetum coccineum]